MRLEEEFRKETGKEDDVYSWEFDSEYIKWLEYKITSLRRIKLERSD